MSQVPNFEIETTIKTMATLNVALKEMFDACTSFHRGATAPANAAIGWIWWDTATADTEIMKRYMGITLGWKEVLRVNTETGAVTFLFGSDVAKCDQAQTFSGGQRTSSTALTSTSSNVAIDFAANNDFTHTLIENTTLANPTNIVGGQKGRIYITQAATAKTLAFGSYWKFADGAVPEVSTDSGAIDCLYYDVLSPTAIAANLVKGFA